MSRSRPTSRTAQARLRALMERDAFVMSDRACGAHKLVGKGPVLSPDQIQDFRHNQKPTISPYDIEAGEIYAVSFGRWR
jgi:hypothetical protein